jgi:hypothetical protein
MFTDTLVSTLVLIYLCVHQKTVRIKRIMYLVNRQERVPYPEVVAVLAYVAGLLLTDHSQYRVHHVY